MAVEDGQETELVFEGRDFERKFFSDETNASFVRCFFDHAKRDPLTGEIGKTIAFAVSRRHATKLVTLLNDEATRRWPEAYGEGSAFAVQVTSDQPGAQQMTIDFANNNLNGKSRWRAAEFRDYDTSRTRVCVTVGMMTTGYDCEDVLNVVLARPIFSPTDFIQIKGRGTRLFTFKHGDGAAARTAAKEGFALFDFFANCEFFETEFDYDKKIPLPKGAAPPEPPGPGGGSGGSHVSAYTNTSPDPIAAVADETIGLDGMKIDREIVPRPQPGGTPSGPGSVLGAGQRAGGYFSSACSLTGRRRAGISCLLCPRKPLPSPTSWMPSCRSPSAVASSSSPRRSTAA
ncbi:MAG: hypothetical protein ACREIA_12595 [Opitutaceae bacterium]